MTYSQCRAFFLSFLLIAMMATTGTLLWADPSDDPEANTRSCMLVFAPTFNAGPHGSTYLYFDQKDITAGVQYTDSNLFGRSWNLSVFSALVYNDIELSKDEIGNTGLDVAFGVNTMLMHQESLEFYDDHQYLIESRSLGINYLGGRFEAGYTLPIGARFYTSYDARKEWDIREKDTADDFILPEDVLHTTGLGAELDMLQYSGPTFVVPVGFRIGAAVDYQYYQGFREWGESGFWNEAPKNGLGTTKFEVTGQYGTCFLERANVGVALGIYGGTNYYTRTYHRLGSPSFGDSSLLFLRGYPSSEFEVETAAVGHLDLGYQLPGENVHLGLFSDISAVLPVRESVDSWRSLYSAGIGVSTVLPWELWVRLTYAHGFTDLSGDFDHWSDTISLVLIRSFMW